MRTDKVNILRGTIFGASILGLAFGSAALASGPINMPQAVVTAAVPQTIRVPAGTVVELEFIDALSSKTSTTGQTFGLKLSQPVVIDGQSIIPAGAIGGGEVIDASRSGMGGRSGKLIVSGRFLEVQGQRVRIRGLQSVLAGQDRSRTAVNTVIVFGVLGTFIQGGDVEISAGTSARAQLAVDLVVTVPIQSTQTEVPTTAPVQ